MRKLFLGIIGIVFLVWAVRTWAATEIERINVDFSNQDATLYLQSGNFALVNQVIANGDTVESNVFIPNGGYSTTEIKGNAFTQIFGGLIQKNAVDMDAITNAATGQTGDYIAQTDSTFSKNYGKVIVKTTP